MRRALAVSLFLLASPVFAQAPVDFTVSGGTISYKLIHKLHEIVGTSKKAEGKARILPNGTVQVMVRAPVESFDSGNGNRDAHMLEAVEGSKHPLVELKGVTTGFALPASYPAKVKTKLKGVLTFHGVKNAEDLELELDFADAQHATVSAAFPVSLEDFKVERPSLMFVKVEDALKMEVRLELSRQK